MAINFLNTVAVDDSVLFVDTVNDRVGVGTTTPVDALDIDWDTEGVATDLSGIRVRAYRPHLNLIDRSGYSTTNGHNFQIKADEAKLQFNATSADNETFDLTRMVINKDGNVGIGTTSPDTLLDVSSPNYGTTAPTVRITSTLGVTDWSGITSDLGRFEFFTDDDSGNAPYTLGYIGIKNDRITGTPTLPSGAMVFATTTYNAWGGAVERMRITSDGNVGIGTTSPAHKLTVNAPNNTTAVGIDFPSAHFDFSANSTSGYTALFNIDDTGLDIGHNVASRSLNLKTNNLDRLTILGNGNVGIGTTSPQTSLSVVGETSTNNLIGGSINLATPSGWVIPSGIMSTRVGYYGGDFTLNGSYTENGIEWGLGPFNDRQLLWTTIGSTDSNSDGGWNKTLTNLDIDSPYLSVVYFKRVSLSASGTFYHGTGNNILNLDGTSNANPYFTVRSLSLFDQGVWYASVGVIQSNSDSNTTAYQDISGLYRLDTGVKVANANAYKFASTGATLSRGHRAYLYYSTDTSVVGHFANPGFYKIDGDQPKLHDIVSGDSDDVFWSANGNSIYNDNSGNVGIGTSSPGSKLDIVGPSLASQFKLSNTTADTTTKYGALVGRHYTNSEEPVTGMLITSNSSATGGTVSIGGGINAANAVNNIILYTAANNTTLAGTERMRVASNGNVGIGVTSPTEKLDVDGIIQSNASGFQIDTGGYGDVRLRAYYGALNTSATLYVGGVNGYSYKGVYALSFNVNSDYRLKTNVVELEEAIERVKQINVHRFNWKDKLNEEKVDGFLAHELAEVIPEAVTGEKDAVREDGTLDYQGVDQSKVVPLLTAALQEAISKIEQLETRIQTLENN